MKKDEFLQRINEIVKSHVWNDEIALTDAVKVFQRLYCLLGEEELRLHASEDGTTQLSREATLFRQQLCRDYPDIYKMDGFHA